jgi:hypothetical protein
MADSNAGKDMAALSFISVLSSSDSVAIRQFPIKEVVPSIRLNEK